MPRAFRTAGLRPELSFEALEIAIGLLGLLVATSFSSRLPGSWPGRGVGEFIGWRLGAGATGRVAHGACTSRGGQRNSGGALESYDRQTKRNVSRAGAARDRLDEEFRSSWVSQTMGRWENVMLVSTVEVASMISRLLRCCVCRQRPSRAWLSAFLFATRANMSLPCHARAHEVPADPHLLCMTGDS